MKSNNKLKIYFSKILLLSLWIGIGVSCMDKFDDINTPLWPEIEDGDAQSYGEGIHLGDSIDPDNFKQLQEGLSSIHVTLKKFMYEGVYNNYQVTTNLTHDIYAGYFANMNPSWLTNTPAYMYSDGWSSTRWSQFYVERSREYGSLARTFWFIDHDFEAGTGRYLNAFYMVRIYYAFLISMQTDTYGDIPLSDYTLQGVTVNKAEPYRTQKEVYEIIFALLEDAVSNLDLNREGQYNPESFDWCYQGDMEKWLRFANTLRLRLALRVSNADPKMAEEQAKAALAHPAGLMKNQEDNMKTIPKFAPMNLGGENSGGDENIHALCSYKWFDSGMNKDLEIGYKTQAETLDPRCKISWYRPLDPKSTEDNPIETENDFLGSRTGEDDIQKPSYRHSLLRAYGLNSKELRNDAWFGYARESVWLSYAESIFLKAEAALRGWDSGNPFAYFLEGIIASMDYYQIDKKEVDEYISNLKVIKDAATSPFVTNDREGMLREIITQKWLAVFPNGNEGWAEFRRTDYPAFIQLPLINASGGEVPQNKFIKRISYPLNERDNNAQYVPKDVTSGTRVWWDVEDTNDASGKRLVPNNFR